VVGQNVNVSIGQKVAPVIAGVADDPMPRLPQRPRQTSTRPGDTTPVGWAVQTDQQSPSLVTQAEQQLASAKQSRTETLRENRIRISQSESNVSAARKQLADDKDAAAPDNVIQADKDALQQAKDSLALLRVQVDAQNRQADQVDSPSWRSTKRANG
jgi:hypothetical protein